MLDEMKGAIFDLDGVIVNTAKYHYLAWKRLAALLGFDFTEEDNERLKGVSRMRSLEILLEIGGLSFDEDKKAELALKKNQWYVEYINRMDRSEILDGAIEYILKLKNRGIAIALGSASKNAHIILDNLKIYNLFDVVIDGNRVSRAKPDPEAFLLAAQEMKLNPWDCAVYEDSEAGIEAAKLGGMMAVGIGDKNKLKHADIVVKGLYELV